VVSRCKILETAEQTCSDPVESSNLTNSDEYRDFAMSKMGVYQPHEVTAAASWAEQR
jgi:hypothetical protein